MFYCIDEKTLEEKIFWDDDEVEIVFDDNIYI
jgi:hypothetical protein